MSRAKAVQEITQELLSHVPEHGSRLTTFDLKHFCNPNRPHREYPVLMKLKAALMFEVWFQQCLRQRKNILMEVGTGAIRFA